MEAPFRFPITGLADVERLLELLASSPHFVQGSLRFADGWELLAARLASEGRAGILAPVDSAEDFIRLMRALWQQPLCAQSPRFLRFNARLSTDPAVELSVRIDVPTIGEWPRWIDLEGSRDPATNTLLRQVYQMIGKEAGVVFLEI